MTKTISKSVIYIIFVYILFIPRTAIAQATPWWDVRWGARFPVSINPSNQPFIDKPVTITVSFSEKKNQAGFPATAVIDLTSIRVIDPQTNNAILPSQVDPSTNNNHTITFIIPGTLSISRTYYVYFDIVRTGSAKPAPPTPTSNVTTTDNISYKGQSTIKLQTTNGTYYYHKEGGGFASYIDSAGQDWISFEPTGGSAGNFRGIPNLVHPDSLFHPGDRNVTSTLTVNGPIKAVIDSVSNDGAWATQWAIYPNYAHLTVTKKPATQAYWFLYEGVPGGAIELQRDFYTLPNGLRKQIDTEFAQDIAGDEWIYFGDSQKNIVLYVASGQDDTHADSHRVMEGNMTVFGFGRRTTNKYLQQAPATFTFAFAPNTDHTSIQSRVLSSIKPIVATAGSAEITSSTTCTKKYIGDADCRTDPSGNYTVSILDYAIWYTEFIGGCSSTRLSGCGTDSDGDGNTMDANFNFPGTSHSHTDSKVDIFDYAVWIQGFTIGNGNL